MEDDLPVALGEEYSRSLFLDLLALEAISRSPGLSGGELIWDSGHLKSRKIFAGFSVT